MDSLQVVLNGLVLGAVYSLISSGLTLIWGMMNVVNFAHGEFLMAGMYIAVGMYALTGVGAAAFVPAAAAALFLLGTAVYFVLIRHVMKGPMLAQILSTFGLMLFLRYVAFWAFSPNYRTLPADILGGSVSLGPLVVSMPQLIAGLTAAAVTLASYWLLIKTRLGSQLLAVAEDPEAAMLMGIRPERMQALAWGMAAAGAGIAGSLLATFYYTFPEVGATFGLIAFVVVTLGGFGSVPGALLAGFIVGLIQALGGYLAGPQYKEMIVFALFLTTLWLRPQGLMGRTT